MTVLYVTAAAQPRKIIRTFLNYSVDTVTALHPWSPLGFTVIRKSLYDMEKLNKKSSIFASDRYTSYIEKYSIHLNCM